MARTNQYTNEEIISALKKYKGAVYLAAEALGCAPDTVYKRAKKSASVQNAIDVHRGKAVDTAELALYNAVLKGENWAIAFLLKTQGRSRGYGDRLDIGIDLRILQQLKQQADDAGVNLSEVFEAMINELGTVNATADSEE